MNLFGRTFLYEDRATLAIQKASEKWANVEDIMNAIEWNIMREPLIGDLLNERGLRGFVYPGARSIKEPDVGVIYEAGDPQIIIHSLMFRDARSHYAGQA